MKKSRCCGHLAGPRSLVLLLITILCASGPGCGGGGGSVSSTSQVTIGINPLSSKISIGATQPFSATVAGTSNQAVTWKVQEGAAGGTVTQAGVYTAPNTPGTYHVVATSNADPTHSATATIQVQAGSASGTIQ